MWVSGDAHHAGAPPFCLSVMAEVVARYSPPTATRMGGQVAVALARRACRLRQATSQSRQRRRRSVGNPGVRVKPPGASAGRPAVSGGPTGDRCSPGAEHLRAVAITMVAGRRPRSPGTPGVGALVRPPEPGPAPCQASPAAWPPRHRGPGGGHRKGREHHRTGDEDAKATADGSTRGGCHARLISSAPVCPLFAAAAMVRLEPTTRPGSGERPGDGATPQAALLGLVGRGWSGHPAHRRRAGGWRARRRVGVAGDADELAGSLMSNTSVAAAPGRLIAVNRPGIRRNPENEVPVRSLALKPTTWPRVVDPADHGRPGAGRSMVVKRPRRRAGSRGRWHRRRPRCRRRRSGHGC